MLWQTTFLSENVVTNLQDAFFSINYIELLVVSQLQNNSQAQINA